MASRPPARRWGCAARRYYRRRRPVYGVRRRAAQRRSPLTVEETTAVLDVLHEDRFADLAPAQVYATLLDEDRYLCSERTMYRILGANDEVRERRAQLVHPRYAAPELLATAPNQLWSWDITKLKGPTTWSYYLPLRDHRRVQPLRRRLDDRGPNESATLAEKLIAETCDREGIEPGQLTVHADRGSSMTSKLVAQLLADLGVTKTHSRPHVSNDNPYSEAAFKTLKYRPWLPRALRLHRGRARPLRRLLRLVQRRALPQRPRPPDPRRRSPRPCSARRRRARRRPRRRPCRSPRALRPRRPAPGARCRPRSGSTSRTPRTVISSRVRH